MIIVVVYKVVVNLQDVCVELDGRIDWFCGKFGISDYDLVVIQVVREVVDVFGIEFVGVSVGMVVVIVVKEKKNVLVCGLD